MLPVAKSKRATSSSRQASTDFAGFLLREIK
jgi:hypothetical protein